MLSAARSVAEAKSTFPARAAGVTFHQKTFEDGKKVFRVNGKERDFLSKHKVKLKKTLEA